MKLINFVPLALVLTACSTDSGNVDLGDDKVGSSAQTLQDYEGDWDGYAEAYEFPSGSDRLRISLDANGNGTIQFGEAPALAPFTNPNIGYPESDPFDTIGYSPDYNAPREGFDYPVHEAGVADGRLRFSARGSDIVRDFCEAQTEIHETGNTPTSYTCSPSGGSYGEGDEGCADVRVGSSTEGMIFDCGLIKTCFHGCVCDATSCSSRQDPGTEIELDGALTPDDSALVGTLVIPSARITVRLTRQP
jgi:hypothetical protein